MPMSAGLSGFVGPSYSKTIACIGTSEQASVSLSQGHRHSCCSEKVCAHVRHKAQGFTSQKGSSTEPWHMDSKHAHPLIPTTQEFVSDGRKPKCRHVVDLPKAMTAESQMFGAHVLPYKMYEGRCRLSCDV